MDICSLFANTLDNAIEASKNIVNSLERKITIKARTNHNFFSYSITNTKANDIVKYKDVIISSKQDNKRHGFGLKNVCDIVEKYHGTIDIKYTDNEFTVIMIIKK